MEMITMGEKKVVEKEEEKRKLVKVEFPRMITGALGLGKLENVSAVQDDDICGKDEVVITINGLDNENRVSFIVNREMTEWLLSASMRAFIYVCQEKGLSVKKEFLELYPALVS